MRRTERTGNRPPYPRRLRWGLLLLYEGDILVVDKPPGLLSVATETEKERTAYWILREYLRKKGGRERPAAVHRLDRDTSGIMIFAGTGRVKKRLMDHWDEAILRRSYAALVEGDMRNGAFKPEEIARGGLIDAPLGEEKSGRVVVMPGGKPARTRWKLLAAGNGYSLLELELETGRRNQIRAHLHHLGYPVAGDKKYNAKTDPLGRLCLHAAEISLRMPQAGGPGEILEFRSPVPPSFRLLPEASPAEVVPRQGRRRV
ncbi:MAG: RNA pseudouridine synthase [Treponema sp.]|jgi:23S rRNA pseudouridine1911/1915/1917 synthase|nr:RNA pseudouridine synthase [Treponema sp.]